MYRININVHVTVYNHTATATVHCYAKGLHILIFISSRCQIQMVQFVNQNRRTRACRYFKMETI